MGETSSRKQGGANLEVGLTAGTQDGEEVVAEWVVNVLDPVGVWSLAGHVGLESECLAGQREGKTVSYFD